MIGQGDRLIPNAVTGIIHHRKFRDLCFPFVQSEGDPAVFEPAVQRIEYFIAVDPEMDHIVLPTDGKSQWRGFFTGDRNLDRFRRFHGQQGNFSVLHLVKFGKPFHIVRADDQPVAVVLVLTAEFENDLPQLVEGDYADGINKIVRHFPVADGQCLNIRIIAEFTVSQLIHEPFSPNRFERNLFRGCAVFQQNGVVPGGVEFFRPDRLLQDFDSGDPAGESMFPAVISSGQQRVLIDRDRDVFAFGDFLPVQIKFRFAAFGAEGDPAGPEQFQFSFSGNSFSLVPVENDS